MARRLFRSGICVLRSLKCSVAAMNRFVKLTAKRKWGRFGMQSNVCSYCKNVLVRNSVKYSKEWGTLTLLHASKSGSNTQSVKVRRTRGPENTAPNQLDSSLIDLSSVDKLSRSTNCGTGHRRRISKKNTLDACWCIVVLTAWGTTSGGGTIKKNVTTLLKQST